MSVNTQKYGRLKALMCRIVERSKTCEVCGVIAQALALIRLGHAIQTDGGSISLPSGDVATSGAEVGDIGRHVIGGMLLLESPDTVCMIPQNNMVGRSQGSIINKIFLHGGWGVVAMNSSFDSQF